MSAPTTAASGLPWKRLLLTTDFSEDSIKAWEVAAQLAALEPLTLTVLHVTEPPFEGLRIHTSSLHDEMRQAAEAKLAKLAEAHFVGALRVTSRVEMGRPVSVICQTAKQAGTELIVISSRGQSGLAHVLLGSVAEGVVRCAPCAVLVVPVGAR